MSRLFITGDTHGDIDWSKLKPDYFPEGQYLTKNDFVIVCGDFGCIWDGDDYDNYIQNWYNECPWTTLFVDGNHENHDLLDAYPVTEWHGGKVHMITDNIIHLMRGQVYNICGQTIFTMGGATSHDKAHRKEGESWWARELPSDEEYEEGFKNLSRYGNKVDMIVTHCAPDSIQHELAYWYEHDKLTNYLEVVRQTVDFEKWFCAHYHVDRNVTEKFQICYDEIIEI